ncbi:MAG: hypothetical protein GPJ54_07470 [Candidatus Heimdallarchaeota archaeon]|nr:hypothetical protein [Candidatus Heimdallarchaeota archaeon]
MATEVTNWLLKSDPSIVFQTKRDILHLSKSEWIHDQKRILTKGWGKQLLDLQDKDGRWGGGLYGPKFISTHYTLLLLRRMEIPPNAKTESGCLQLMNIKAIGSTDKHEPRQDACITGMGLNMLAYFQVGEEKFDEILEFIEYRKIIDGAWNCRHPRDKTSHSSFHTTISVLEGLASLVKNYPRYKSQVQGLTNSANEFLLIHELFKSHKTGQSAHPAFEDITFPPRWKYNILSALDYFQSINYNYDKRMTDAISIVQNKEKNGYWNQGKQQSGKKYFSLNKPRKPSEFNTMRALRVLDHFRNRET